MIASDFASKAVVLVKFLYYLLAVTYFWLSLNIFSPF